MKPGDRILYKPSSMENRWITVEVMRPNGSSVQVKRQSGLVSWVQTRHTKPIKEGT